MVWSSDRTCSVCCMHQLVIKNRKASPTSIGLLKTYLKQRSSQCPPWQYTYIWTTFFFTSTLLEEQRPKTVLIRPKSLKGTEHQRCEGSCNIRERNRRKTFLFWLNAAWLWLPVNYLTDYIISTKEFLLLSHICYHWSQLLIQANSQILM